MARKSDLIGYVYRYRLFLTAFIMLAMPVGLFLLYMKSPAKASIVDEPYSIIILAGQSNAEGSNTRRDQLPAPTPGDPVGGKGMQYYQPADTETGLWVAGADGATPQTIQEFLFQLGGGTIVGWYGSNESFGSPGTGNPNDKLVNLNYKQLKGVMGSDIGIGRNLYEVGRRKVIILKVTYGFQSLAKSTSSYVPYDWNVESVGKSYDKLKSEFGLLTNKIKNDGGTYTVDGFMWMQGETDGLEESYTAQYKDNMTALTTAARTDFQMHPDAHFVIGKVTMTTCIDNSFPNTGDYCGYPYLGGLENFSVAPFNYAQPLMAGRERRIRDAQQFVADQSDKIDVVDTGDLKRSSDFTHMNEASQSELGRRFVNMYRLPYRNEGSNDYDGDGFLNPAEDTGNRACGLLSGSGGVNLGNKNLGDDDCDGDGYPNYIDALNGVGNGL